MGQTLSHGVYLPNEGERNCYAGLASNWQILNTAVGAIAEKAPLVHTHGNITNDGKVGTTANQPLITGTGGAITAGAFGNQANTFCEGNDSRLSDARTPVAHTHTKSDVTDLLNSNFIPSANNAYNLGSSSYQWKTLNGINPGALSLPDMSKYDNVTSQVQPPTGESTINIQGGANTWTASADGYLIYMGRYNHFSQVYLYIAGTYIGAQMSTDANSTPLYRFISVPVCKNQVVQIQVYGTQFNNVYFYPNLGNG